MKQYTQFIIDVLQSLAIFIAGLAIVNNTKSINRIIDMFAFEPKKRRRKKTKGIKKIIKQARKKRKKKRKKKKK